MGHDVWEVEAFLRRVSSSECLPVLSHRPGSFQILIALGLQVATYVSVSVPLV